jgi:endonuclease YncB( thermonuclease family)
LPLRQPRRIFVRQPRRTGLRGAGLVIAAGCGIVLANHQLRAGVARIFTAAASPGMLSAASAGALTADDVSVMDGQTLRIAGRIVRLDGLAAPRPGLADGAALHLAALVRDQRVACQVEPAGPAEPAVARCEAGGTDLNRALVASGWAEARDDAPALQQAESAAREQHLGLWASK